LPSIEDQPEESEIDRVKKDLEELQVKYNLLNDTYLRSLAEFDNYRKRSLREKADLIKNGGENVLVSVLTVVDDVERGLAAMKDTQDLVAIKEGMELIFTKMQGFLRQNGVTPIETEGKDFDTDLHEAITTLPAPSEDLKGKVVDCVQKGYILNDKVIRFAKVVVGE
jgi:molecular chaperone GrpE